jgi:hypothetical protein
MARTGLMAIAIAGLAGCDTASSLNPFSETAALPCPFVRVLGDGEAYLRYRPGAEPVRENLEVEARFITVDFSCDYEDSDDPRSAMALDLSIVLAAERGAAMPPGGTERLPYFVALIGPDREVVARQSFETAMLFPEEGAQFYLAEPEEVTLDFPPGGSVAPWEYEVVVSFQLTEEQLARKLEGSR